VVPAAAFVDRTDELRRLTADLEAAQKIFLISPRRYGKSSLIRRALATMSRRGALTVEVTVSSFSSYVAFLEGYARALGAAETTWDRARSWLREAISSTRIDVGLGGQADPPRISFPNARTERDVSRLAEEVFALPARLAAARRRKVIVALDEFQAIAGYDGGSVEHALRAAVQHQRDVGYVFAGSEPSLMERMLSPRRPFYKAGPVMRLEKIAADEFADFIDDAFERSGMKPEAGLGAAIVELAENLPYDVQRLAHETWDEVRGRLRDASASPAVARRIGQRAEAARNRKHATLDDLHQALKRLLAEHQMLFEAVWQHLTLTQRAALRAVVLENGRGLLSADVRTRHRLGGASTVQRALAALVRDDIVTRNGDRYAVVDSLLREWVARKTF